MDDQQNKSPEEQALDAAKETVQISKKALAQVHDRNKQLDQSNTKLAYENQELRSENKRLVAQNETLKKDQEAVFIIRHIIGEILNRDADPEAYAKWKEKMVRQ